MRPNFWNDTSMSWAFSPWRCGDEMERSENDMMLGDQNEVLYYTVESTIPVVPHEAVAEVSRIGNV